MSGWSHHHTSDLETLRGTSTLTIQNDKHIDTIMKISAINGKFLSLNEINNDETPHSECTTD